jgi:hypothetical protein
VPELPPAPPRARYSSIATAAEDGALLRSGSAGGVRQGSKCAPRWLENWIHRSEFENHGADSG